MNVGHVRGTGGVEPTPNRHEAVKRGKVQIPRPAVDQASISQESKAVNATVEELTTRVRQEPEIRSDRVAEVRARLESGALDSPEVFAETARRILG